LKDQDFRLIFCGFDSVLGCFVASDRVVLMVASGKRLLIRSKDHMYTT
jgi:hypothetical protein